MKSIEIKDLYKARALMPSFLLLRLTVDLMFVLAMLCVKHEYNPDGMSVHCSTPFTPRHSLAQLIWLSVWVCEEETRKDTETI